MNIPIDLLSIIIEYIIDVKEIVGLCHLSNFTDYHLKKIYLKCINDRFGKQNCIEFKKCLEVETYPFEILPKRKRGINAIFKSFYKDYAKVIGEYNISKNSFRLTALMIDEKEIEEYEGPDDIDDIDDLETLANSYFIYPKNYVREDIGYFNVIIIKDNERILTYCYVDYGELRIPKVHIYYNLNGTNKVLDCFIASLAKINEIKECMMEDE